MRCAVVTAAVLVSGCAMSPPAGNISGQPARLFPQLQVRAVEYDGVKKGLVRGIVGAPEEMLDTAVRNAGSFGAAEARGLREALLAEAHAAGFGGDGKAKPVILRVRVLTHLARVGELWPGAEYLVEAEYSVSAGEGDGGTARTVNMCYRSWFYWSMESLRRDVMQSLAGRIIRDAVPGMEGGAVAKNETRGRAKFFADREEAREEFAGE